jgi:hypothetical protein
MYSIRAVLEKEPAAIAEAVRAIFLVLVAFQVVSLGEEQLAIVLLAASAVLTLFVRNASTSKSSPTLAAGTEVSVQGTEDKVIVAPTPPGPMGIEGGPTGGG